MGLFYYMVLWLLGLVVIFVGLYSRALWSLVTAFLSALLVLWVSVSSGYDLALPIVSSVAYFLIAGLFAIKAFKDRKLEKYFAPVDFDNGKHIFYFLDKIESEIAKVKKHGGFLTVAKLDMDHFKSINEKVGHLQGDMLLRLLGRVLVYNTRPRDMAVRYAADEFLIVFPETSAVQAHKIIDDIRGKLEEHRNIFPVRGIANPFSFSAGIVEFSDEYKDVRDYFRVVDEALFEAKKKGPSAIVVLDKEKRQAFRNRRYWERIDVTNLEGMRLFIYDKDGVRHSVEIGNMSVGGSMFLVPKDLKYGDVIDMELELPNGERIIIEGKQIWSKADAMAEQVGVFLMHLSPQQKFVLHRSLYNKKKQ